MAGLSLPPIVLFVLYLALGLAPVALAWQLGLPPRPWLSEVASGMALVGFVMLMVEFVLSGRFRLISNRMGIDATMRFHQYAARPLTAALLVHPFLYVTPFGPALPWDWSGQHRLDLSGPALITGIVAWLLLGVLVIAAIMRDRLPFRYELWRMSHGVGAALIAALGTHHAIEAGRYSGRAPLSWFWLAMLAIAGATLLAVYVVRPLLQMRHPYRVTSVRRIALKTWELVVAPQRGEAIRFEAGQFVWLTLDGSPFAIREHPFSIASAPAERGGVAFVIKEAGDFTDRIGGIPVGASAYLDGPHGGLVLGRQVGGDSAKGIAFIAGGVGIAPILSMLRQLAIDADGRPMKLIYGNRVREQIIYEAEIEQLRDRLDLELTQVLAEPPPGWSGAAGQLDAALIERLCAIPDRADWLYVVCGPPSMIDSVEDSLTEIGVPARRIVSEKFGYF